ncbi:3-hydroxybutyrate dehydrogenase [Roseomonas marmotae]|uniref:3-hydroxybutyrate dehydrogenase n=1 Tax=Roseomonas marmotae TaxID=2768161 RepID=A0ABS3KD35_9PROT|nr:3-hydroxybutyrate dehydrogenase [Roseomonas marmotae]MBO1075379.1 3-hydroxybutyrate dehydrogenase [Roseomonas marmotae]QTI78368.1 3-hydroxybutyrate dehydrogenase [Roseomonas marmotae]
MEQTLSGRTAVITGSTSGIGLGIATMMAAAGARVMLNGFGKPEDIAAARRAVAEAGDGTEPHHSAADLSKPAEVRAMLAEAASVLGQVDILVNNAGIQFTSPVEDFPEEKWDAVIAINLSAVFHATKAVIPGMKQRNWGRIINIASAHGLVASPEKVAYVAAKHGVVGMTKVTAVELAQTGVTCNAICPGFVRTPLAEVQVGAIAKAKGISEEAALKDHLLAKQPSKRWVEVPEVARMALYLCGPDTGSLTGAALSLDGGWVAS